MKCFSVATFNVHMWSDAKWQDNVDRVVELVKKHNPDLLCLQEAYHDELEDFSQRVGMKHFGQNMNCAILSKIPIEILPLSKKARVLTAKLEMKRDTFLYLTCLHLDHRLESFRLKEIESIRQNLDQVFKANHCQIWTGDFNALTKEDYNTKQWQEITNVRQRSLWELPQTDVTSKVKEEFDFQDAWTLAGRPGTSKTCRFDTHIDYIFCNSALLSKYAIDRVEHVEDTASDHNMVIATFKTL